MDRATDDPVVEPPLEDGPTAQGSSEIDPGALDLSLHKQRLKEAARAIDPLSPLRRHPLVTIATAAAVGVVAASPAAARVVSQLIPGGAAAKIAQRLVAGYLSAKALRGSGHTPRSASSAAGEQSGP